MKVFASVLLWAVFPLAAQIVPNPEFHETAVISAFHRRNPDIVHFQTFYRKDLGGEHTLLLVRGGAPTPGWRSPLRSLSWNRGDLLGLFLIKTANPDLAWELDILTGEYDVRVEVERADDRSIVLSRYGDYGLQGFTKLFFDATSRRMQRRIEFTPVEVRQILARNGALYFIVGAQEQTVLARLVEDEPKIAGEAGTDPVIARAREAPAVNFTPFNYLVSSPEVRRKYLPIGQRRRFSAALVLDRNTLVVEGVEGVAERFGDKYKLHKLPKSTYGEFARARPGRVRDGYRADVTSFEDELIAPYQIAEDRFWFGKTFYDGEGSSGVGGFGYFDPKERRYVVFSPPEIASWSTSALLVEEKNIWLGLARRPEGQTYSGGLLRYERDSGKAEKFDIGEVISQIKRWRGALYLATGNGLFILNGNRSRHYVFEPELDGGTAIFRNQP